MLAEFKENLNGKETISPEIMTQLTKSYMKKGNRNLFCYNNEEIIGELIYYGKKIVYYW